MLLLFLACQAPPGGGAQAPDIVINEVVARNSSTWDDGTSSYPDWIELYNAGDTAVPLTSVTLSDGEQAWRGGAGRIEPGHRLFVRADGKGGLTTPFRIGPDETLTVEVDGVVTDRLRLGDVGEDVAWARHPDGGSWAETTWATPDAPNLADASPTLDPSDDVFGTKFHDIEIELSDEAVESLRAERLAYVEGAVIVDGLRYAPVEIRLKSLHGSRRTIDEKPGWKIDLDALDDFRWKGLEALTLNNLVQDPTYLREHLAYTLYRAAGVPGSRITWARVRLNGEDYGVSTLIENVNEEFLARWYADPSGALYEGASGCDLIPGTQACYEYDSGPVPQDDTLLDRLITALDHPPDDAGMAGVEALVNYEEVLTHLAVEAVALHWDGYRNGNNYRLYHDPTTQKFELIPWGADEAFDRVVYDPWSGGGRLAMYCMANPGCLARYEARLVEIADLADALDLTGEATRVEAWLRPAFEADPKREYDLARHDEEMAATLQLLASWPGQVRGMVEAP